MKTKNAISISLIESRILFVRGKKVMLDSDLAKLYGVKVKALNQAVRRNKGRFPSDFMFQLNHQEVLRSQFVTAKLGWNKKRYLPYVFTEQGTAMLSSVLNSERAIHVNIEIMRAFVKLREMLFSHKDLQRKIEEMEKKYDKNFSVVFKALRDLFQTPSRVETQKRKIGFEAKNLK